MDTTSILTIIGVNVALFGAFGTLVFWAINKLDSDIKDISTRIDSCTRRLDGHASRIDQLYTMFVDLLKEKRS